MSEHPTFTIGPPEPVLDSRRLPAVTSEDEAGFVTGADLGADHPDNTEEPAADEVGLGPLTAEPAEADDTPAPGEAELDALVDDVDPDDVDQQGFDDSDLAEPVTGGDDQQPVATGGS